MSGTESAAADVGACSSLTLGRRRWPEPAPPRTVSRDRAALRRASDGHRGERSRDGPGSHRRTPCVARFHLERPALSPSPSPLGPARSERAAHGARARRRVRRRRHQARRSWPHPRGCRLAESGASEGWSGLSLRGGGAAPHTGGQRPQFAPGMSCRRWTGVGSRLRRAVSFFSPH